MNSKQQLKKLFRQIYTTEEQVDKAVRDAMKAYTIVKQDPQYGHDT